jgi:hypothetical protein
MAGYSDSSLGTLPKEGTAYGITCHTSAASGAFTVKASKLSMTVTDIFQGEIAAAHVCANEMKFFMGAMNELGLPNKGSRKLHLDSETAIKWVTAPTLGKSKHLLLRHQDIKDKVAAGEIVPALIPGKYNRADLMTKILSAKDTRRLAYEVLGHGLVETWPVEGTYKKKNDFGLMPQAGDVESHDVECFMMRRIQADEIDSFDVDPELEDIVAEAVRTLIRHNPPTEAVEGMTTGQASTSTTGAPSSPTRLTYTDDIMFRREDMPRGERERRDARVVQAENQRTENRAIDPYMVRAYNNGTFTFESSRMRGIDYHNQMIEMFLEPIVHPILNRMIQSQEEGDDQFDRFLERRVGMTMRATAQDPAMQQLVFDSLETGPISAALPRATRDITGWYM